MHQLAQSVEPTDEEKVRRRVLKTVVSMVAWLYREAERLHMPFGIPVETAETEVSIISCGVPPLPPD
jgi:hypothetical protein